MDSLTELFCLMDDFCQKFEPALEKRLLEQGQRKRRRQAGLCLSELLTLDKYAATTAHRSHVPISPGALLHQVILDRVMRQFRVVPQFHLLQQARAVHADGFHRQR